MQDDDAEVMLKHCTPTGQRDIRFPIGDRLDPKRFSSEADPQSFGCKATLLLPCHPDLETVRKTRLYFPMGMESLEVHDEASIAS